MVLQLLWVDLARVGSFLVKKDAIAEVLRLSIVHNCLSQHCIPTLLLMWMVLMPSRILASLSLLGYLILRSAASSPPRPTPGPCQHRRSTRASFRLMHASPRLLLSLIALGLSRLLTQPSLPVGLHLSFILFYLQPSHLLLGELLRLSFQLFPLLLLPILLALLAALMTGPVLLHDVRFAHFAELRLSATHLYMIHPCVHLECLIAPLACFGPSIAPLLVITKHLRVGRIRTVLTLYSSMRPLFVLFAFRFGDDLSALCTLIIVSHACDLMQAEFSQVYSLFAGWASFRLTF